MLDTDNHNALQPPPMTDTLKSWMMVILTLIFVLLYAGVFIGWITTTDAIKDLQPIIFVIIGYYFGRLPSQQNENSLKEEINRQSTKANAAANAKEKALQEREALEEKIKNVKAALSIGNIEASLTNSESDANKSVVRNGSAFNSIETALKILSS